MKINLRPMEVQSRIMRAELRQFEMPVRGGQSKSIVVEVYRRSRLPAVRDAQEPMDVRIELERSSDDSRQTTGAAVPACRASNPPAAMLQPSLMHPVMRNPVTDGAREHQ
jgi:hypothetical protein